MKQYLKFLFLVLVSACYEDIPLQTSYSGFLPKQIDDGWLVSIPEKEGYDSDIIDDIFSEIYEDEYWMVKSMVIISGDKIIGETYKLGENYRTEGQPVWSITKQIVGIITGIALDNGIIESLDDPIGKYLPELYDDYPQKAEITIYQLLTMTSGLMFETEGLEGDNFYLLQNPNVSFATYSLQRELIHKPGDVYKYKESDPILLTYLLDKILDGKLEEFIEENLYQPLDLKIKWLKDGDNIPIGGYGVIATPRELSKLMLMVMNNGVYNNQRVLSSEYIELMTSGLEPSGNDYFGLQWWSSPSENLIYMAGHGGQFVLGYPEMDLIVSIMSQERTQGDSQFHLYQAKYLVNKYLR